MDKRKTPPPTERERIEADERTWADGELARYTPPERHRLLRALLRWDAEQDPSIGLVMKVTDVVRRTGAGRALARKALEARALDVECAVEWIERKDLAAVMPEESRFPLWAARQTMARVLHKAKETVTLEKLE